MNYLIILIQLLYDIVQYEIKFVVLIIYDIIIMILDDFC